MLRTILSAIILLWTQHITAQSVSGAWYGRADVAVEGIHSNYLTELVVKQRGNEVTGVFSYYFRDSYQSFFVRGTYNKATRQVVIKNLPVLFYAASNTQSGIECPMTFEGTLLVSKAKNSLKGSFHSIEKYKYTCPEIRVNMVLDVAMPEDSVIENSVAGKQFWKPQVEDIVVANPTTVKPDTINGEVALKADPAASTPLNLDSIAQQKLIAKFESRKNIYSKDLEIEGDSIRVTFYDNGDIDGDSISVFLNHNPVMSKHVLNDRALNIYLALDSTKEVNELGMFAENLGRIPPNTALMVITDGKNRYEVYLSSSLTQNAAVRLRKKK